MDAQWLRENVPQPTLNQEEQTEEFLSNVMSMIRESQKVWTFDELLSVDEPEENQQRKERKANADIENILKQLKA